MRGVHLLYPEGYQKSTGSSPHARGPPCLLVSLVVIPRIIPACAGSTIFQGGVNHTSRDHPRMRGVHYGLKKLARDLQGSSPHARGPPILEQYAAELSGIIPACAGSTEASNITNDVGKDHPRMRGVHKYPPLFAVRTRGSSPHARGPPGHSPLELYDLRIIPACAGSTIGCRNLSGIHEDHPRMRGVHRFCRKSL